MSKPFYRCLRLAGPVALFALLAVSCDGAPTRVTPPPPPPPPLTTAVRSTGPIAFTSDRDGIDAIYLANADGSAVTRLTNGIAPAWSPDGRQIVFQLNRTVYVINADGSGLRLVTPGDDPDWSPDGGRFVFQDGSSITSGISVIEATGSDRRQIFNGRGGAGSPAWSPDGKRIAFTVDTSSYTSDSRGLSTMNTDGSDVKLLDELGDVHNPAWSSDGSEIAFISPDGISVIRADGSGRRMVVTSSNLFGVDWTPDGRVIYGRGNSPSFTPMRIFVNDAGLERQLVPDATSPAWPMYRDYLPSWSKSGR